MFRKIFSFILSPLTSAIYNIFVLGPLHFFNLLNTCFDFVVGSNVSDLLFKTNFVNGKTQLNFFQSSSPLKPMFMTMVAIGAMLIVSFSAISIASNLANIKNRKWIKKTRNLLGSTTGIFLVPLCFLTILSLCGVLINVINGKRVTLTNDDQIVYNTETKKQLKKIKDARGNLLINFGENQNIIDVFSLDEEKNVLTIGEIYDNFFKKEWNFMEDDPILQKVEENKTFFLQIKNLIKSQDFLTNIENATIIIDQLKPNLENEDFASLVKNASQYFYNINENIDLFLASGNEINKNLTQFPKTKQDKAFFNFKKLFDYIVGKNDQVIYSSNTNISNFLDLKEGINSLVNGTLKHPKSGLFNLRQQLSNIKDNNLVVKFYQLTTNKKDVNWENPKWISGIPPNLFVGSIVIYVAIVIMSLNIIFAVIRILNLALLFVISPTVVMASSIDNGTTFKGWLKVVLSNLLSIFGVLITLKLFGIIFIAFDELTQKAKTMQNGIGSMAKNVLLSLFGLGGLFASRRAGKQIDKMFGYQKSFFGSFEGSNILRIFQNATRNLTRRNTVLLNTPLKNLNDQKIMNPNFLPLYQRKHLYSKMENKTNYPNNLKNWSDWKKWILSKGKNNNG